MNTARKEDRRPVPRPVLAPLTSAAIFLVLSIKPDRENYAVVRSLCADFKSLTLVDAGIPGVTLTEEIQPACLCSCSGSHLAETVASKKSTSPRTRERTGQVPVSGGNWG